MGASVGVFDDGLHDVVVFGDQHVARGHVNFPLIDLGARLIEAFFDVAQIKHNVIGSGFADDANDLTFLDDEGLAAYCS